MKLKLLFSLSAIILGITTLVYAQSGVAISESANQRADASAILDVVSTSKGMLVPRMTNAQRNAISSPALGLLIYQTNSTPGFYYYDGSAWQAIGGGGSGGSETDPQVSSSLANYIPKWNGSTLIDGSMRDEGSEINVFTNGGAEKMRFTNLDEGSGLLLVYGPSLSSNIVLGNLDTDPDKGFISVSDAEGDTKSSAFVNSSDAGVLVTRGANGDLNTALANYNSDYPNNGALGLYDASGVEQASIYVDENGVGQFFLSGAKNFRVPHPQDDTKEIWYAALEGPEAAMYARGTATLVNGEARITLPEHFAVLAAEKGLTVITTPLSAASTGLAVVEKSTGYFVVKELMNGTGTYEFDWEVKSVRKGFEDYEPVRQKVSTGAKSVESIAAPQGITNKAKTKE